MSIGIAIALNDMVLLVADGRHPGSQLAPTDRPEKITARGDTLAIIEFGDDVSARTAATQLQQAATASMTGRGITDAIVEIVQRSGTPLREVTGKQVGLIAGGIDAEGAWVGGAVFGHGLAEPLTQLARPGKGELQFVVLGGEPVGAKAFFTDLASRAMSASGDDGQGLLVMLQRAAKKTIRHAANRGYATAGRVEWRLLVKGQPTRAGYL